MIAAREDAEVLSSPVSTPIDATVRPNAGMSRSRIFIKLVMPQMWRIALPGLGNLFMILMKDTALVSVIGLEEIMRHAQIGVTVTKQPFTFFMVAAFMYLGLTVLAMTGMHFLEKRASRGFARSTQ